MLRVQFALSLALLSSGCKFVVNGVEPVDLAEPDGTVVKPDLAEQDETVIEPDLLVPDMTVEPPDLVKPDFTGVTLDLVTPPDMTVVTPPDLVKLDFTGVQQDFTVGPDLVVPPDMTVGPDLVTPPDLTAQPDLTPALPGSCKVAFEAGDKTNGYKMINPGSGPLSVYCLNDKQGGGWTRIFHHKTSGQTGPYFPKDAAQAEYYHATTPEDATYSILKLAGQIRSSASLYEFLYVDTTHGHFVQSTQTGFDLATRPKFAACEASFAKVASSPATIQYPPCGFVRWPEKFEDNRYPNYWALMNGATDGFYFLGQSGVYPSAAAGQPPLVCLGLYSTGQYLCDEIEFYVR